MKGTSLPNLNHEPTSYQNFFTFFQDPNHHDDTTLHQRPNIDHSQVTEPSETSPFKDILSPFASFNGSNENHYPVGGYFNEWDQMDQTLLRWPPSPTRSSDTTVSVGSNSLNELKSKLQASESDKEEMRNQMKGMKKELASKGPPPLDHQDLKMSNHHHNGMKLVDVEIDVKIIGWDAMIRIQSNKKNHPAATLMSALKELDLDVHHASVAVVNDLMIQQATVKMGSRLYTQEQLREALSAKIANAR